MTILYAIDMTNEARAALGIAAYIEVDCSDGETDYVGYVETERYGKQHVTSNWVSGGLTETKAAVNARCTELVIELSAQAEGFNAAPDSTPVDTEQESEQVPADEIESTSRMMSGTRQELGIYGWVTTHVCKGNTVHEGRVQHGGFEQECVGFALTSDRVAQLEARINARCVELVTKDEQEEFCYHCDGTGKIAIAGDIDSRGNAVLQYSDCTYCEATPTNNQYSGGSLDEADCMPEGYDRCLCGGINCPACAKPMAYAPVQVGDQAMAVAQGFGAMKAGYCIDCNQFMPEPAGRLRCEDCRMDSNRPLTASEATEMFRCADEARVNGWISTLTTGERLSDSEIVAVLVAPPVPSFRDKAQAAIQAARDACLDKARWLVAVEKAAEELEAGRWSYHDGGLKIQSRTQTGVTHLVDSLGCSCLAARRRVPCWHRAAWKILKNTHEGQR